MTASVPNQSRGYFVANTDDELHCLQACYAMTVARLSGQLISATDAEEPTAFRPGKRSWPLAAIRSLAERGISVRTIDTFDAAAFAADPVASVRSWYPNDPAEAERLITESDLEAEAERVRNALATGRAVFESRVPDWDDLSALVRMANTVVIARVNHRALMGREGAYGHFVLVDSITPDGVRVQDPGPPIRPDHMYPTDTFRAAWQWPDDQSGELIVAGDGAMQSLRG